MNSLRQGDMFAGGAQRLQMTESIELTIQSLQAYGAEPCEWRMNWALREKTRLEAEVSLHEDAAKWRAFCADMEVAHG